MSGNETELASEGWSPGESEGLFLQSVQYMWQSMTAREEQFFVKASFSEIYNE